jgi:hypothetical protein
MAATILIKTAKEAEKLLKAVGAVYEFTLPTGEIFGNKPDEPKYEGPVTARGTRPKRKSMARGYPYGYRLKHVRDHLGELGVGEVALIPMDPGFENIEDLRKTVASAAVLKWGKEAHRTAKRDDGSGVEILRTA